MLILDTDLLSLLERADASALALQMRLDQIDENEIVTTVISYEEQMRGWLGYIAQANTSEKMLLAYEHAPDAVTQIGSQPVCRKAVQSNHEKFAGASEVVRIGSMDLKIASVCLANAATLLTRNSKDFGQVPGLKFEDWSV